MSHKEWTLPKSWIITSIGEISDVVAGGTPPARNPKNFAKPGAGIAWLTPADLSGYTKKYISHGARDLSQIGYESSSAKLVPPGSLLFSSRAPIGYVAIANNEICTNQGFKNFIFPTTVDSSYAYYFLRNIRGLAESLGTGTTFKEISATAAKTLPFALPPLKEQKIIAGKLDALFAQVEGAKAHLERIPNILECLRQSILMAAITGKLTEEWRNICENQEKISTSKILEARRIAWENSEVERQLAQNKRPNDDKWKEKYRLPEHVLSDECFNIPASWTWSNLGEISWSVKDGPHYSPEYTDTGIPFISGGNVSPKGINFSGCKYISKELHEELSARCKPTVGDILYTKGGTTGIAYFNQEKLDFNVWVHVAVLKISNIINGNFLQHALNSRHCYNQAQKYTRGVGNQDLGLTRMVKITIPVPPIQEQIEIVKNVERLFAIADILEERANAALKRISNLFESILAKAFRGEITAEWRDANPDLINGENSASALLAKILAEREKSKKQPKLRNIGITKKTGASMSKQIIKVTEALRQAGEPLSGQQLLAASGYPSDSNTEDLEKFFLDIREALILEKSIIKLDRSEDGQDWFALPEAALQNEEKP